MFGDITGASNKDERRPRTLIWYPSPFRDKLAGPLTKTVLLISRRRSGQRPDVSHHLCDLADLRDTVVLVSVSYSTSMI
jgi:hypothetical protein